MLANFGKVQLLLAVKWPQIKVVAFFAGDDVEMQMEHALLCALSACVQNVYAGKTTIVHKVVGNLLHGGNNALQTLLVAIQNVGAMLLWNYQSVAVAIARNVQKRKGVLVFVDFVAGNFPLDDFAKNAVVHSTTSPFTPSK